MEQPKFDRVFELQDQVMINHLSSSKFAKKAYELISEATLFNVGILGKMRFDPEKQDVIGKLAIDAISPIIVAVRVALWGNMPESLAVLRAALESSTQLQFVVREGMYKIAAYELYNGFKKLEYKNVLNSLGKLGEKTKKLHGLISEAAVHATASRLKWNSYEHEGDTFSRVGFARDTEKAELPLFYCMDVCLLVTDALVQAYEQEQKPFAWSENVKKNLERHRVLKEEFLSRF